MQLYVIIFPFYVFLVGWGGGWGDEVVEEEIDKGWGGRKGGWGGGRGMGEERLRGGGGCGEEVEGKEIEEEAEEAGEEKEVWGGCCREEG